MKRLAAFLVSAVSAIALNVPASAQQQEFPAAFLSIDGQVIPLTVERGDKSFTIAGEFGTDEGQVTVDAEGNPDPSIFYALGVTDLGAPSSFGFFFGIPIVATFAPNVVTASIVGGLTDADEDGDVTLTPLAPAVLTADGDATVETQVANVGPVFTTMGVDVGLAVGPGAPGAVTPYGPFQAGPIAGPGPGPWTVLAVEANFSLTGGGDSAGLTGFASIVPRSVPEPTTLLLLGLCLVGLVGISRRNGSRN